MAQRRVTSSTSEWLCDLDLERQVLGAVLTYPVASAFREAGLAADAFSCEPNARIWAACEAIQDAGGEADATTVAAELRKHEDLERVGGAIYLLRLTGAVPKPRPDAIVWQTGRLLELAGVRTLAMSSARFRDQVLGNPDALADGTVEAFLSQIDSVRAKRTRRRQVFSAADQWAAMIADGRVRSAGAVSTGVFALDREIDGIAPGEVYGLMARPGMGKTVLLCQQARTMAGFRMGHVFFSLEMPAGQIVRRLVQGEYRMGRRELDARIDGGHIRDDVYLERFDRTTIIDEPGLSVAEMSRHLRRLEQTVYTSEPIRCVTIDHLGLIGGDTSLSTYDRVSKHGREIKELAKRHQVAVCLAIQVNRESGGDGSKELHLGSARDSGIVEEAVDYLVGLRRFDRCQDLSEADRAAYRDVLFLKLVKNRHEAPGLETACRYDMTLDVSDAADMTVPSGVASARVAHFGGRR